MFVAQKYHFKSRDKNTFYEYLELTTAQSIFLPANSQKGAIYIDSMSTDRTVPLHNITVEGENLGQRMNSTYNENPFILEGYEKVGGVYVAINTANQEQLDWASGIVDFPPYSLISNSTFSNL